MKSNERGVAAAVLGLAGLAVLAFLGGLYWALEPVEIEIEGRPGPRARANPYLALTRTLDALGVETTARPMLVLPPQAEGSVVFLFPPPQRLSTEQAERVMDWVARGGTLVVGLMQVGPEADPLYQTLGLNQVNEGLQLALDAEDEDTGEADPDAVPWPATPPEEPEEPEQDEQAEDDDAPFRWPWEREAADEAEPEEAQAEPEEAQAEPEEAEGEGEDDAEDDEPTDFISLLSDLEDLAKREPRVLDLYEGSWTVEPAVGRWLEPTKPLDEDTLLAGFEPDSQRFTLAWLYHGDGEVIAVADASVFDNKRLEDAEHARMAWTEWVSPLRGVERAVIIYRVDDEDILDRVWTLAWPAVLSTLALVLAWIWRSAGRFGPMVAPPTPERRSLLEHIHATGTYLWRRGAWESLLESMRAEVLDRVSVRHGGHDASKEEDRVAALAERTRVDPETVRQALHGASERDRRAFTETVKALQEIRRTR
ncbi:MAG: DUF4350 domain-containing protein [Alphaproteobacteria bacterium]|nr:DUF4350 domain-containing protein [Alphaproteobacteria bacterium]